MAALPALPGAEPVVKLASNENALGPSPLAVEAAREQANAMQWYPEAPGTTPLQEAIANRYGLEADRIVVGPGSDELLTRLIRGYLREGDELIFSRRGYAKFANYAHAVDATPVPVDDTQFVTDVDRILAHVTPRTHVVTIANPDNPLGTYVSAPDIRRLHAGLPGDVLLILDSAYAEYVTASDYEDAAALASEAENVVMTRTFSKIYGLAGLRLGWAYAATAIIDTMRRLSATFPVSGIALAAGVAALEDVRYAENVKVHTVRWREALTQSLDARGLRVVPSQTNFVLVDFDASGETADEAERFLLARRIIARRFNSPGLQTCLRITIGLEHEMRSLVDAISEFMDR
ncbi:MAG: pyridoxal phosphate-dependent aminotransferase [Gammaproteobacteria bacterium]